MLIYILLTAYIAGAIVDMTDSLTGERYARMRRYHRVRFTFYFLPLNALLWPLLFLLRIYKRTL